MKKVFKVVLIGDSLVGKSTFVTRCQHRKFFSQYKPTFGVEVSHLQVKLPNETIKINLWDCSGSDKFSEVINENCAEADLALIMFSERIAQSYHNIEKWKKFFPQNIPVLICSNTDNIVDNDEKKDFSKDDSVFFLSTKTGKNCHQLLIKIGQILLKREKNLLYGTF